MKRICFTVIMILILGIGINPGWAKEKKYVMKVAGPFVAHDYWDLHTNIYVFQQELEKRSDGRIKVEIYGGNQLGKSTESVAQTKSGLVQMCYAADGHFTPVYPNIQVFSVPYLFLDRQIAWPILGGKTAQALMDDMAKKTGIRPLVFFENGGFRNFTTSNKQLRTPADLKGVKIRTMSSPLHMQLVKDLGASPTPVPFSELYSALQLKVVDGQENPVSVFRRPKLEEVQKNMILDGHVYSITAYLINERWLQSLPPDLKFAVRQSAEIARDAHNAISFLLERKDIKELRDMGMDVYEPPVEVKNEFRKLTQQSAIDWIKKQKNIDPKWMDMLFQEVKQVEVDLGYATN